VARAAGDVAWLDGGGKEAVRSMTARHFVVRLILTAVTTACGELDKPVDAPTKSDDPWASSSFSGPTVTVTPSAGQAAVLATPPWKLLKIGFRKESVTWKHQFGAFQVTPHGDEPWVEVAHWTGVKSAGGKLTAVGETASGTSIADLEVDSSAAREIKLVLKPRNADWNRATVSTPCIDGEHFIGLGGQSFDVDHRGQVVPLWVEEDGIGKEKTDDVPQGWPAVGRRHTTHTPMPITVTSKNRAILLDTPDRAVFDVCATDKSLLRIENQGPGDLVLHLFSGDSFADTVARVTQRTGRPKLVPKFAFAPWLDAVNGTANVLRVAEKLRAEGVASSVIWSEDWRGNVGNNDDFGLLEHWNGDEKLYPDMKGMAAKLHDLGFKWLTYYNTFLDEHADVYKDAIAGGHTIKTSAGEPYHFQLFTFRKASLLDLADDKAVAWAKGVMRKGLELGADGWMADFAEWLPTDCVTAKGPCLREHNRYPVRWAQLNRDLLDEQQKKDGVERLTFVRAAWLGSQPLVDVVWAGDQLTDWSEGDGLPSVIPMAIGLGATGFPYFGSDIAGYISLGTDPSTEDLWRRWVALGALSPVMRTHHGRSLNSNWHWEKDAAAVAHLKRYAALHIRIFPYLYGLAYKAYMAGEPMVRPLGARWPTFEPGWTRTDQYLLGDRIVVAPVVQPLGLVPLGRKVALPKGNYARLPGTGTPAWLDVAADGEVDVAAGPTDIPAFVPAGEVLVLLPKGVQTLVEPKDGKGGLAAAGDDREVWCFAGGATTQSQWSEAGVALKYTWAAAGGHVPLGDNSATWNGKSVTPSPDGSFAVTGTGKFVLGGKATLTVTGGKADRKLIVRVY
jgi:alpha-glucosidase (family GH31 glycosyl hydrolase)